MAASSAPEGGSSHTSRCPQPQRCPKLHFLPCKTSPSPLPALALLPDSPNGPNTGRFSQTSQSSMVKGPGAERGPLRGNKPWPADSSPWGETAGAKPQDTGPVACLPGCSCGVWWVGASSAFGTKPTRCLSVVAMETQKGVISIFSTRWPCVVRSRAILAVSHHHPGNPLA